jgi:hypothetical protein
MHKVPTSNPARTFPGPSGSGALPAPCLSWRNLLAPQGTKRAGLFARLFSANHCNVTVWHLLALHGTMGPPGFEPGTKGL